MYRVVWLRADARWCRWDEEVKIVPEEMARTLRSFTRMADCWRGLASSGQGAGYVAFAARQAAMWQALHDNADRVFTAARAASSPS